MRPVRREVKRADGEFLRRARFAGEEVGVGVIGEAAERAERGVEEAAQEAVEAHLRELDAEAGFTGRLSLDEPLTSRRAGGDAGHVPGCAEEIHTGGRWSAHTCGEAEDASVGNAHEHGLSVDGEGRLVLEVDGRAFTCSHEMSVAFAEKVLGAHKVASRRLEVDARTALPAMLRRGYALGDGQISTVLRVADALAAGVSLEARETLGREVRDVSAGFTDAEALDLFESMTNSIGERLFAIGRASVLPPDADLARVIAVWPHMSPSQREHVRRSAIARAWSTTLGRVRQALWEAGDVLSRTTIDCGFADDGLRLISVTIDGDPATGEQWAKLRAAGVPVADGVGE